MARRWGHHRHHYGYDGSYHPYYRRSIAGIIVGTLLGALGAVLVAVLGVMAGAARRYRSELAPFLVAGALACAGAWLHAYRPGWWSLVTAATVAGVAGLAAFPRRWARPHWPVLGRGLERAYTGGCLAAGGGWLSAAAGFGPGAGPLPGLLVGLTVVGAVPWWAHRRRRARVRVQHVIDGWPRVAEAAGLSGSRVVSAVVDGWGWTARIALPGGRTAAEVVNAVPQIESGLGIAPGTARAQADAYRADRAVLRVLAADPHAHPIPYQRPAPGSASIYWPVPLGVFDDGSTVRVLFLRRNALVGGVTDSGKSGLLAVILAYLAQCPDVAIWGIDLKGGMELAPWARCLARFATTGQKATAFLAAAVQEIERREAEQVARGERAWEPTRDRPALVIVIDEYVELPEQAHRHADTIARLGRAVAVSLVVATQRPTQKAMARNAVRSQMDIRICLRVRERRDVNLILGDGMLAAGWHAHTLNAPGKFYASTRELSTPKPARAYYLTTTDITRLAAQYGPYSPHPNPKTTEPDNETGTEAPRVEITGPQTAHTQTGAAVMVADQPPTAEQLLLTALRNAPDEGITVPELMAATGKPRAWVYRRLKRLSQTGHASQPGWGRWRTPRRTDPTDGT